MKRNWKQKKAYKEMLKFLDKTVGETDAGLILAVLCDTFVKFLDGVEQRNIRKIEITLNDFVSNSYEFDK